MKLSITRMTLWLSAAAFFIAGDAVAQQKTPAKRPAPPKPVIFAVVNDGKSIEPIAVVDGGKLTGSDDATAFQRNYYKPRAFYSLVFGGVQDGLATVVKANTGSECGASSAAVIVRGSKAKLTRPIFALATSVKMNADAKGYRRRPTPAERIEIEKLVSAEFVKNGASSASVKALKFHNLTAVDVDGDDVAEFIGSYWIAPAAAERRLLFFIAERTDGGAVELSVKDHALIKPKDVMTGDPKDLDDGTGHELLIDLLDYDADGVREIFTIGQAFEGNNYYVYRRDAGKWTKVHETYVYHCAY